MIGYCGLDCEKCDARLATITNDDALREKTAKLWAQLNNAPITSEMINCTGCRTDGVKTPFCQSMCDIRICAKGKGFATCADCDGWERCQTLGAIMCGSPEALAQLRKECGTGGDLETARAAK